MPPSSRRTRARRDVEAQQSDGEAPAAIATPSRKRRRVNGTDAARSRTNTLTRRPESSHSTETIENAEPEVPLTPVDEANNIIRHLRVASYKVWAATDYANPLQAQNTTAYARISGRDWTFYVRKMRVCIGRPNKDRAGPQAIPAGADAADATAPSDAPNAKYDVDIDLGPDQQVSRVHAEIGFDMEEQKWYITVNGRNGLKLDETILRRGDQRYLHSGIVITILGTQMMFLLPGSELFIHPSIRRQSLLSNGDTESEAGDEDNPSLPHDQEGSKLGSKDRQGAGSNSYQPSSQPRNTASSQQHGRTRPQSSAMDSATSGPPATPAAARSNTRPKPSPAYSRGMLMESTEEIDYRNENAKDIKPPLSYAQLIGQAILASPEEKLTLAKIYDYIKEKYAFYRFSGGGWQNSIRHNLSLNKSFEKIARRTDEPGKGMKWQIVADQREEFLKKSLGNPKKGVHRTESSGPSSPATGNAHPAQATQRLMGVLSPGEGGRDTAQQLSDARPKTSPGSDSPSLASSYPTANVSYTPGRGGQQLQRLQMEELSHLNGDHAHTPEFDHGQPNGAPQFVANTASHSSRASNGLTEAATHSPPTLSSSMYDHSVNHPLVTPLVARHQPRLAPPSTAHLPSHFMPLSSPAPFWKFMDLASTPAKAPILDLSPAKTERDAAENNDGADADAAGHDNDDENDDDDEDMERDAAVPVRSSSPPPLPDGVGAEMSPTRTLSRPGSRREAPKLNFANHPILTVSGVASGLGINGVGGMGGGLHHAGLGGVAGGLGPVEEDEEEGIDLAKGFQGIGNYHRSLTQTNGFRSRLGAGR